MVIIIVGSYMQLYTGVLTVTYAVQIAIEQRSYHRVDLTSCLSLTLMRITVQTQLLNLHLNIERINYYVCQGPINRNQRSLKKIIKKAIER